jgi:hypothetical protein
MWAVASAVDVPGAYCTPTVQLPPGLRTVVAVQAVPLAGATIENVPPTVPFLLTAGAAVKVNAPAVVPLAVLLIVTVAVLVVVLAGVVVMAGVGTPIPTVAPVTWNGSALVVPIGVTTVTFLEVRPAAAVIVQLVVIEVAVTVPIGQVTPVPVTFIAVAPVRLVPVSTTGVTVVPRTPLVGAIEVSVAPCGVKVTAGFVGVVPFDVTTVTVLAVSGAVLEIVKVAVTVVEFTAVKAETVMPLAVPPDTTTLVAFCRPVPVMVTGTAVPRTPPVGLIEVMVGEITVKLTAVVVPLGVVTVTAWLPRVAVAAMTKVAVIDVLLVSVKALTVMPPATFTEEAAVRFVPVMITTTVEPWNPKEGLMAVSMGNPKALPPNSVAPGSKNTSPLVSGRRLPKKSVAG